MSQCPFWSTKKEKVSCSHECAFYSKEEIESCPFKVYLGSSRINIKDIMDFNFHEEENLALTENW
ncbi:hypothetical protein [Clostridium polynesiense]|uniref:hypothetical protein n=1 Tax=Clostridium polynesiense TaxID=1325933 RepID=UPI00058E5CB5|nr:hypothetical protein [Clostridium polynesiense]